MEEVRRFKKDEIPEELEIIDATQFIQDVNEALQYILKRLNVIDMNMEVVFKRANDLTAAVKDLPGFQAPVDKSKLN